MRTTDLFPSEPCLEQVHIQDANVSYIRQFELAQSPELIMQELISTVPWRAENVVVWGKAYPQPRLIAWYGDPERSYTYSGIRLQPLPWTSLLLEIKSRVEAISGSEFNSVLLNYYRDNRDSMGFHSDDEPELGLHPTIASISLGQERSLIFKHKTAQSLKRIRLPLGSGSLLIMSGETQRYWLHGIEKERKQCGPRVNLTLRRIYDHR